tara:strand:+ start:2887 stop:3135 length:249 start_codon:yes stop_codon:yes gene_type:complete
MNFKVGDRVVVAVRAISETPPDALVPFVHAYKGDTGTVVYVEPTDQWGEYPTVRFDWMGTATVVADNEIIHLEEDLEARGIK